MERMLWRSVVSSTEGCSSDAGGESAASISARWVLRAVVALCSRQFAVPYQSFMFKIYNLAAPNRTDPPYTHLLSVSWSSPLFCGWVVPTHGRWLVVGAHLDCSP